MAYKKWPVALSMLVATPLLVAASPEAQGRPSPSDSPDTRYCLRIEPVTGSLLERIRCWTRARWTEEGVDVDKEWEEEGVAIIRGRPEARGS